MDQIAPPASSSAAPATVRVWDPLVRLLHWTIVAAVGFTAYSGLVLGARWINPHVLVGTLLALVVLIRLIWGGVGSLHARFASFLVGPKALRQHVRDLRAGRAEPHLGHNPLGGWMIVALLAVIVALALTGALTLGGVFKAGPAKALIDYSTGIEAQLLHKLAAWALLALVAAHIAGALFESLRTRENLVRAMVTGDKIRRVPPLRAEPAPAARPYVALGLVVGVAGGLAGLAMLGMVRAVPHAPVAVAGSDYAAACADCHTAFHPSLLPAASWRTLMTTLDNHFGEDATIDPALAARLTDWLVANSADAVDTKPAHVLAAVNPASPTEIPSTPFWQRTHRNIPESRFTTAPVFSKANCSACHTDAAQGWFYPGAIALPGQGVATAAAATTQP